MKFSRLNTTLISGILLFLLFASSFFLMGYRANVSIFLGAVGALSGTLIVAWSKTKTAESLSAEKEDSGSDSEGLSAEDNSKIETDESEYASEDSPDSNASNSSETSSDGESSSSEMVVYSPSTYVVYEDSGQVQESSPSSPASDEETNADAKTEEKNEETPTRFSATSKFLIVVVVRGRKGICSIPYPRIVVVIDWRKAIA